MRVRFAAQDSHLVMGHAFEIVGRVQNDLSVKVLMSTDFGTNIGLTFDSLSTRLYAPKNIC